MNLLEEHVRELIRQSGFPLYANTPYCNSYLKENSNCRGCESVEGCSRSGKILKLFMIAEAFPPKSFREAVEMSEYLQQKVTKILDR